MTAYGREPGIFKQSDLTGLSIGDTLPYEGGCAAPATKTYESACMGGGFGYPFNGEYVFAEGPACTSCGVFGIGYDYDACEYDRRIGGGADCICPKTGQANGKRCAVTRTAYNGELGSCLLMSTTKNVGTSQTTGVDKRLPLDRQSLWTIMGNNDFTCDPDNYHSPSAASSAANICSSFQSKDIHNPESRSYLTRRAWLPGVNPLKGISDGYCSNFVQNTADITSARTVFTAALNQMAVQIPDFGKSDLMLAEFASDLLQQCNLGSTSTSTAGTCDSVLNNMCAKYSRKDVLDAYDQYNKLKQNNDPRATYYKNLYQSCACHLPPNQYDSWANLGVDESTVACDPLCMLPLAVQPAGHGCTQNLCLINNVTIDIIDSTAGNINLSTICGCGTNSNPGSCRCVFSDININSWNSTFGNINLDQSCGGNCQIPDKANPGNFIQVDCKTGIPGIPPSPTPSENTWTKIKKWLQDHKLTVIIVSLGILLIGILLIWYRSSSKPVDLGTIGQQVTLSDLFGPTFDDTVSYY